MIFERVKTSTRRCRKRRFARSGLQLANLYYVVTGEGREDSEDSEDYEDCVLGRWLGGQIQTLFTGISLPRVIAELESKVCGTGSVRSHGPGR